MKRQLAMGLTLAVALSGTALAEGAADAAARGAYAQVLTDLAQNNRWPDGTQAVTDDFWNPQEMAENPFAVYDVDGDGQEELIVSMGSGCMADMVIRVYGYRDGALRLKFEEFPAAAFYDNGVVQAVWSHNHTDSDFTPYSLYLYDAAQDCYRPLGSAYACDIEYAGLEFPAEADADGDGRVYYISTDNTYNTDAPCDNAEYEAWVQSIMDGAAELDIGLRAMSSANIAEMASAN